MIARAFQSIAARFQRPAPEPFELTPAPEFKTARKPAPKRATRPAPEPVKVDPPAWLKLHLAPVGDDVKRYSPPDFPFPIWSDRDIARGDGRKFTGGKTARAGHVLLKDRRKPCWHGNFQVLGLI